MRCSEKEFTSNEEEKNYSTYCNELLYHDFEKTNCITQRKCLIVDENLFAQLFDGKWLAIVRF